jgi:uncharacterized protein YrzB (UPF0473 family)
MIDEKKVPEEENDNGIVTLTDDDGKEYQFEILAEKEIDGVVYYAMYPLEDNDKGEYVIMKVEEDNGEDDVTLVTIDDDDEYERVADIIEDEFFSEIDIDKSTDDNK